MFTIDKYVVAESLEEAYELNKSRRNAIIGGMLWLRMGRKKIRTAIDLSALNLNKIEEDDESFKIGCMCTLRDLETHENLNKSFNNIFHKSLKHIVGVQMRNLATIGGSIYSRFGFSDILTALLSLDSYAELFKGGIIPLNEYVNMPLDNDILMKIIINKDGRMPACNSHRISATDFPVLTCAVSNKENEWFVVVGARPMKGKLSTFNLNNNYEKDDIDNAVLNIIDNISFGTNIRGSKEYRQILADVLIKRNIDEILNGGYYAD
ncbi:MAG TPA: molybdopterin dehydrogenase [Clostridiales bacterium]|nr:molybdopterin dehydrogenase [Clostridiales bacterium]